MQVDGNGVPFGDFALNLYPGALCDRLDVVVALQGNGDDGPVASLYAWVIEEYVDPVPLCLGSPGRAQQAWKPDGGHGFRQDVPTKAHAPAGRGARAICQGPQLSEPRRSFVGR